MYIDINKHQFEGAVERMQGVDQYVSSFVSKKKLTSRLG